ncbi:aminoethylphosphonate catabolism LysR family transcriptional regulator [Dongia mobilis]|uniref:Aminoethylphosphonate catabolism LysR family transcriptional regulator n=1 Tax=Dongia mobilis TaxID=578943 RepID=A0A4R6WZW6_9PROT|nr:LysR substrate-binding domain-containing protein [Dongia mobilis]TDQ83397.1 aminoethylphosphonate catabolism LysR family transcriptional regulator [Dongia mobilis]
MRYSQLRAFDAVARSLSFSRAAEILGVTQPAVSLQVAALERAYRTDLIARHGSRISLTGDGEALFALTRQMFGAEAEIEDFLASSQALRRGHLRFGADAPHIALDLVAAYRAKYPAVTLELVLGNATQTWNAVLQSVVDIAALANPPEDPRLGYLPLATQGMMLLVPRGHEFARRREVSLREIGDRPVIFREHDSNTQRTLEAKLKKMGLALRPVLVLGSREAMVEAVSRKIGLGFIFTREKNDDPRSVAIPLKELKGSSRNMLVYLKPRRRRRAVAALIELAGRPERQSR